MSVSKTASTSNENGFQISSIGTIRRESNNEAKTIALVVDEPFRPAMKELEYFSHIIVYWWADRHDTREYREMLQCNPPYAPDHTTGVFATRAPYRPNPISMTTCKILNVDETGGIIKVADIDAFDGTHIIDLKAYFPVCDKVQNAHIPEWLSEWPDVMPEQGIGLMEGEE